MPHPDIEAGAHIYDFKTRSDRILHHERSKGPPFSRALGQYATMAMEAIQEMDELLEHLTAELETVAAEKEVLSRELAEAKLALEAQDG